MTCRACRSPDLVPLWTDADGCAWSRCAACGSDTSTAEYRSDRYGAEYARELLFAEGRTPLHNHAHNADTIERWRRGRAGRTFLDVGCATGASLEVMRGRGWATVGWDVSAEGRPPGTVVSDEFGAELFARAFDAVLCREVLEHVPEPRRLLSALYEATAVGGVMHLTTPRPLDRGRGPAWQCYHWAHLCVWHPDPLREELAAAGFVAVETDLWELGQRHVCRRRGEAAD